MSGANERMERTLTPRARQKGLLVEELLDETLVYDREHHRAHCLNQTAALVWQHCDGETTVAEVAALVGAELKIPTDETVVWMALDRLGKARLLRERVTLPAAQTQYSRRAAMRTLGLGAGLALLLPVVETVVAPHAAAQGSCISAADCKDRSPPFCNNTPICNDPGTCCITQGAKCASKDCPV